MCRCCMTKGQRQLSKQIPFRQDWHDVLAKCFRNRMATLIAMNQHFWNAWLEGPNVAGEHQLR